MQPDIIDRLRAYAEVCEITGAYTETNCAYDAIEEIKNLREQIKELQLLFENIVVDGKPKKGLPGIIKNID